MRALLAALLASTALPAFADTILAESTVTAVTVYPQGAKITREVRFDAPGPGAHDLVVTDMPGGTVPGLVRLQGDEGLVFGAFSLRGDRLPPRAEPLTADQQAAKTALEQAEARAREMQAAVEAVAARIRAAEAQAGFLSSFSGQLPDNATPDSLKAMAAMIGAETLAASGAIAAARADLWPAEKARDDAEQARAEAQAAFDALPARDADYTALSVAVDAAQAGPATMTITHYIENAGWRPFYDLHLTRTGGDALTIERAVLVTQYSGEDWAGVDLVLSSSRPSEQAAPSTLWPEQRWIETDAPPAADMAEKRMVGAGAPAMEAAVAAPAPITAAAGMEGDTVVYTYPRKVDVASGVEDLRLSLDRIEATPDVVAVAVPRWDRTAFVQAEFVNPTAEPILPGEALLYREGVLVGQTSLGVIAPGQESKIAFGALESVQISRNMPLRDGGTSGVFTTSNDQSETAVLKIENLGAESWPVRVLDQIPYSEQQDLQVTPKLDPAPTETDLDGQRGILAWDFDLPAGQKKEISVGYALQWPDGMVLR